MRNPAVYVGAIILGIIALIVGVLYEVNAVLGYHPTRGYAALAVGAILIIIGIVGFVTRSRGPA